MIITNSDYQSVMNKLMDATSRQSMWGARMVRIALRLPIDWRELELRELAESNCFLPPESGLYPYSEFQRFLKLPERLEQFLGFITVFAVGRPQCQECWLSDQEGQYQCSLRLSLPLEDRIGELDEDLKESARVARGKIATLERIIRNVSEAKEAAEEELEELKETDECIRRGYEMQEHGFQPPIFWEQLILDRERGTSEIELNRSIQVCEQALDRAHSQEEEIRKIVQDYWEFLVAQDIETNSRNALLGSSSVICWNLEFRPRHPKILRVLELIRRFSQKFLWIPEQFSFENLPGSLAVISLSIPDPLIRHVLDSPVFEAAHLLFLRYVRWGITSD